MTNWYSENTSFDCSDESEHAVLPQKYDRYQRQQQLRSDRHSVPSTEWMTAIVIAFDMALTENKFEPKKFDSHGGLTALMILTVRWESPVIGIGRPTKILSHWFKASIKGLDKK